MSLVASAWKRTKASCVLLRREGYDLLLRSFAVAAQTGGGRLRAFAVAAAPRLGVAVAAGRGGRLTGVAAAVGGGVVSLFLDGHDPELGVAEAVVAVAAGC